jgi:SWI/SNF-related matrix-associated actin-dependent regulator of chromatin subfamily A-like protein 1
MMRMITNRFPAKGGCAVCQTSVPALAGWTANVDGRWVVWCTEHKGTDVRKRPVVVTTDDGPPRVSVDMTDFGSMAFKMINIVDAAMFMVAKTAIHGATRNDKDGSFRCPVEIGAQIVDRLRRQDSFVVDVLPKASAFLQAHASQGALDEEAATDRARAVDEQLRARGQALFPFQKIGCAWLAKQGGAILGDDMGLGKTIQALVAAPEASPVVVVCPNVAKGVWLRESRRWRPDLRPTVLSGRNSFRWPEIGEMVVINYDVLSEDQSRCPTCREKDADDPVCGACVVLPPAPQGVVLIADEAHALKNLKAARSRRFRVLAAKARKAKGRVWLLTGTPLLNDASELWALLSTISKAKQVFGSFENFIAKTGIDGGVIDTPMISERLQEIMLRRLKRDHLKELPGKLVEYQDVDIDPDSVRVLGDLEKTMRDKGIDIEKAIQAAFDGSDAAIDIGTLSAMRKVLAVAKVPAAIEFVDALSMAGVTTIVFSAHRAPAEVFGQRDGWALITGDTSAAERTAIEDRFQRGELRGVAGTIAAMGVAITLTRASHVVFVDPDWVPAMNEQGEDRAYRIGQTKPVTVTYLVADHAVDRLVAKCLARKRQLIAATVDAAVKGAA